MPQIFHRSFNTISRVTIFGAVFIAAGLCWFAAVILSFVLRHRVAHRPRPAGAVQSRGTMSASSASIADTVIPRSKPRRSPASRRRKPA